MRLISANNKKIQFQCAIGLIFDYFVRKLPSPPVHFTVVMPNKHLPVPDNGQDDDSFIGLKSDDDQVSYLYNSAFFLLCIAYICSLCLLKQISTQKKSRFNIIKYKWKIRSQKVNVYIFQWQYCIFNCLSFQILKMFVAVFFYCDEYQ